MQIEGTTQVVVDRMERAVPGLQPSDFEVLEDAAPRPITSVEFRQRGGADPPSVATDEAEAPAAREPGTRVFAFFLDELHIKRIECRPGAPDQVGDHRHQSWE